MGMSDSAFGPSVKKVGMKVPISLEFLGAYERPSGYYVKVGPPAWAQRVGYAATKVMFRFSEWLSGRVGRSRHVSPLSGYDYEPAVLWEFEVKRKWVSDG